MNIEMQQAVSIYELKEKLNNCDMPLKIAYNFTKLFSSIQSGYDFYKSEFRKIVDEFAQRDKDGNYCYSADGASISIMSGREVECQAKLEELFKLPVEVPNVEFKLKDIESMTLNLNEMQSLMPFIINE